MIMNVSTFVKLVDYALRLEVRNNDFEFYMLWRIIYSECMYKSLLHGMKVILGSYESWRLRRK